MSDPAVIEIEGQLDEGIAELDGNDILPDPSVLKSIKIKSGVVKRFTKDKLSYEKEALQQKNKLEQFKAEQKDESTIRNAVKQKTNCLKETEMMIPDISRRLTQSYNELKELLNIHHKESPIGKSAEYTEAVRILETAVPHV